MPLKTSVFIGSLHIRVIIVIELRFVRIGRLILIGKKSVSPISDQTNFDRGEHIVRDAFGIRIKVQAMHDGTTGCSAHTGNAGNEPVNIGRGDRDGFRCFGDGVLLHGVSPKRIAGKTPPRHRE